MISTCRGCGKQFIDNIFGCLDCEASHERARALRELQMEAQEALAKQQLHDLEWGDVYELLSTLNDAGLIQLGNPNAVKRLKQKLGRE